MKSKWTTYVLLIAVCVVWGGIAWRLFFNEPKAAPTNKPAKTQERKSRMDDTLFLSYSDPFLGRDLFKTQKKSVKKSTPTPTPPKQASIAKPPTVHKVRYIGKISKRGVLYCLVEIEGNFITLAVGQSEGDYELVKIYGDSVRFLKGKEYFNVTLSK